MVSVFPVCLFVWRRESWFGSDFQGAPIGVPLLVYQFSAQNLEVGLGLGEVIGFYRGFLGFEIITSIY